MIGIYKFILNLKCVCIVPIKVNSYYKTNWPMMLMYIFLIYFTTQRVVIINTIFFIKCTKYYYF